MDDDMKELHHDDYPSQSAMQEWFEANREIYSDFKSKIQSVLKNPLCDNHSELTDEETATLQSIIMEAMTTEEDAVNKMIDRFSYAIKDGNVSACCLYCYLELDNGVEEIENAMTNFEQSEDAKYIKDGIHAYLEDKKRETQETVNKDLNLLNLRKQVLAILADMLYAASVVFKRAIDAIIYYGADKFKSIFDNDEAADIKSVMQSYGETKGQQQTIGNWLCDYADSRQTFDKLKHRQTYKEVADVANGAYDWKIEKAQKSLGYN